MTTGNRIPLILAISFLIATSCAQGMTGAAEEDRFHFGLRWVHVKGFEKLAAELGAEWVTFDARWDKLEPEMGKYDWKDLDRWVGRAQSAGLRSYVVLYCVSPWGTPDFWKWKVAQGKYTPQGGTLPETEQSRRAWVAFMKNMAERYDLDGEDDMPGLKYPIRYFQVCEEWPTAWDKRKNKKSLNVVAYVELLRLTRKGVRLADPGAKVAVAGLTSGYRFVPFGEGAIEDDDGGLAKGRRLTREQVRKSKMYRMFKETIDYMISSGGDAFDVFTIHAFEEKDTFLEGKIRWLREALVRHGQGDKEILLSAGSGPFTNTRAELDAMDAKGNVRNPEKEGGRTHFHGDFSFEAWTMARQANFVIKMNAVAMAYDVKGPTFVLGSLKKEDNAKELFWSGPFRNNHLVNGECGRKPAFYTYKMMASKLKGFTSAEKVAGGPGDRIFRFSVGGRTMLVAWNNKGSVADLSEHFSIPEVKITAPVIALDGNNEPIRTPGKTVPAASVKLKKMPVFIEASE